MRRKRHWKEVLRSCGSFGLNRNQRSPTQRLQPRRHLRSVSSLTTAWGPTKEQNRHADFFPYRLRLREDGALKLPEREAVVFRGQPPGRLPRSEYPAAAAANEARAGIYPSTTPPTGAACPLR